MKRTLCVISFLLAVLIAQAVLADTVLQYSFDGVLGTDVASGLVDDTGTYTAEIIAGSDAESTIEYGSANPFYNPARTSADFYNDNWENYAGDTFLIADSGGINFSSFDEFTIEMFINPLSSGAGKTRRIFSEYVYAYMYLDADNTLHAIRKWGGGDWDENRTHLTMDSFPHNEWTHIAMTWDSHAAGDKFKLYVNYELQVSGAGVSTATIDSTAGFTIGGYQRESGSTAQFFHGSIDEFRFSDEALDPTDFLGAPLDVSFEEASSSNPETVCDAVVPVHLSKAVSEPVTVDCHVIGGTADGNGIDYALVDGRLTFAAEDTSEVIHITIIDDELDEEDETIVLVLSNPTGGVELGPITEHTYTIVDPRPVVEFSAAASETMENVTPAQLEVTLSAASDEAVTVRYEVTGGSADGNGIDFDMQSKLDINKLLGITENWLWSGIAGENIADIYEDGRVDLKDYAAYASEPHVYGGILSFDPCETTQYISIDIVDDPIRETLETVELSLSYPENAKLGDLSENILTIIDDQMGQTYTNSIGMQFVHIAPGTFTMGSENGHYDEVPTHTVNITQPFYMGAYEVTNAQYEQFDPDHALIDHRGFTHGPDEAVIFVSWEDANAFCSWLSEREGLPYRLPTEAEWEYACRAGTTTDFFTGSTLLSSYYNEQNQTGSDDPDPVPLTVGTALPNPWGLYDMHGNVEEWCYDWHGPYEAVDQSDPVGRVKSHFRVTRSGSHGTYLEYLRSANRLGTIPNERNWFIGLRLVIGELPDTEPLEEIVQPYQIGVIQEVPPDINEGPDPGIAYFVRRQYVKIPDGSKGPLFSKHNHVPALVECDNGDMLAAWYTCKYETPRKEHAVAVSRLRYGADEWDWASSFWEAPDRNDHTTTFWKDEAGKLFHFQGLGASRWNNTIPILRTSTDNGVTWTEPRFLGTPHGSYSHVESTVFRNSEGKIFLSNDLGGGTKIRISEDNGDTWYLSEGRLTSNHGVFAERDDGSMLGFSRKAGIDGKMPQQESFDMGASWTEPVASVFNMVSSGRRCVLLKLREGPLFLATFGTLGETYLIAATSYDGGATWPYKKLMTDCSGDTVETTDGVTFVMDCDHSEPRGYCAGWQGKNGVIHLITSRQHYAFNLAWLIE